MAGVKFYLPPRKLQELVDERGAQVLTAELALKEVVVDEFDADVTVVPPQEPDGLVDAAAGADESRTARVTSPATTLPAWASISLALSWR
jgi:hypothetical protein